MGTSPITALSQACTCRHRTASSISDADSREAGPIMPGRATRIRMAILARSGRCDEPRAVYIKEASCLSPRVPVMKGN